MFQWHEIVASLDLETDKIIAKNGSWIVLYSDPCQIRILRYENNHFIVLLYLSITAAAGIVIPEADFYYNKIGYYGEDPIGELDMTDSDPRLAQAIELLYAPCDLEPILEIVELALCDQIEVAA